MKIPLQLRALLFHFVVADAKSEATPLFLKHSIHLDTAFNVKKSLCYVQEVSLLLDQ
jgi:hypothetical protein